MSVNVHGFSAEARPGVIFPLSRFQAHKSADRGDWFVMDSNTSCCSRLPTGETRYMSMADAINTADWLNEAHQDRRVK